MAASKLTETTDDQDRVLLAIDELVIDTREQLRSDMLHVWDELVVLGLIAPKTIYIITPAGRSALHERATRKDAAHE